MEQFIEFIANHTILVGIFVALLAALLFTESRKGGRSVDCSELTTLVNQKQAVVVDLRDKKEFSAGHIVDAIHIPSAKLAESLSRLQKHKEQTIILVDAAGQHAGMAARTLMKEGYAQVVRLKGGMSQWSADGLPLVKQG